MLEELASLLERELSSISLFRDKAKTVRPRGEFRGAYTDGSFSVSERRGAGIALFSASTILMDGGMEVRDLGPEGSLLVLVPKYKLQSRAATIMRMFEVESAIRSYRDADAIFFDGSFLTVLLSPSAVDSVYRDFMLSVDRFEDALDFLKDLLSIVKRATKMGLEEFIEGYYSLIRDIVEASSKLPKGAVLSGQNYGILLMEYTASMERLAELLELAERDGKPLIWVAKDSESRILSKEVGGSLTDLVIADLALKRGTYLPVNEIIALPPVAYEKVSVRVLSELRRRDRVLSLHPDVAGRIYGRFSSYSLVYAKLSDFAIQMTFPKALASEDEVVGLVATASRGFGYPKGLVYAHHRCKLRMQLAGAIAESFHERCVESVGKEVCRLLELEGRKLVGL